MQDKTSLQAEMLANRLQKRFRHLKKWAQRTGSGSFRLYDRDIPEIPLVFDYYGDSALPQEAAICGALYKRPYEKDETEEEQWLSAMKTAACAVLGIPRQMVFFKQRQKQRGGVFSKRPQYEKISEASFEKIISEGSLAFKVNLSDYLDTGLFPDRRLLRAMVRAESAGKKVLNLFSYTGSFSVYAASGGAASTDSVDLSNTYLSWARENFSLNGFSASLLQEWDFFSRGRARSQSDRAKNDRDSSYNDRAQNAQPQSAHKLIRADVLDFLEKAVTAKSRWDIIVLDPPSFSNSKKMTESFDLRRDIAGLLKSCLGLLEPGGKIFVSINTRRGAVTAADLSAELQTALSPQTANMRVTDISEKIVDEDFKGRKTPKSFLITP